jgi:hypothetical protein
LIARELAEPVATPIAAVADAIRARHAEAALAVLFYGSCLRQPETLLASSLLDFYLLVNDYRAAYGGGLMSLANRLLPPNVFYLEVAHAGAILRCKYAVISLAQFREGVGRGAQSVSLWARFSQQSRLVWSRDASITSAVVSAATDAVVTMMSSTLPLMESTASPEATWQRAFTETYRAELRPEDAGRASELVAVDLERYRRVTETARALLAHEPPMSVIDCARAWQKRRRTSKLLNLVRLLKATFTFDGAVDYALWKIKRHSGVTVPVSDWQRRHPFLSAPVLAWKLYRRGAFR